MHAWRSGGTGDGAHARNALGALPEPALCALSPRPRGHARRACRGKPTSAAGPCVANGLWRRGKRAPMALVGEKNSARENVTATSAEIGGGVVIEPMKLA